MHPLHQERQNYLCFETEAQAPARLGTIPRPAAPAGSLPTSCLGADICGNTAPAPSIIPRKHIEAPAETRPRTEPHVPRSRRFAADAKLNWGALVHLKKHNKVAIMVSNESLTYDWFLIEASFPFGGTSNTTTWCVRLRRAVRASTSNAIFACRPMPGPNVSPVTR